MIRVLSLGAGVQSTTIALMAAHGELPPIDAAVFADTQSEPQAVYDHLARLMAPGVLPFPVHVVTKGSLRQEILDACRGTTRAHARPPLFVKNPDGSQGMTRRQCTENYKINVILKQYRTLAGIKPRSRGPVTAVIEQLTGISIDEAHRQKDARFRWIRNTYPLIELQMHRRDCEAKLASYGWTAPKSACTFCPYHDDRQWLAMKRDDPVAWADAVDVDRALREAGGVARFRGQMYLHRDMVPLDEVDLEARIAAPRPTRQLRLYLPGAGFGDECSGVCGV